MTPERLQEIREALANAAPKSSVMIARELLAHIDDIESGAGNAYDQGWEDCRTWHQGGPRK